MTLLLLLTSTVPSPPSPTAGTYSWRVRATDEHGMASEWSSADTFTVTLSGSLPVVTLAPLATSTTTTPTSTWSVYDLDGDAQTHYQVQTASDAGFTADVVDSGIVASTNMHHSHAVLATGTWYRRVKVCTATTDWSEWDSDSFAIVAGTAQTDAWEIWRDASGTPAQIDPATYPSSAPIVTCKPNGPTSFSFMVNNFDGLCAGITSTDDILLYLKDSLTGNRIEFRGLVTDYVAGRFLEVTCQDVSYQFDRWKVEIERDHVSLASIITAMVQNPTGSASTGIVAHVEEIVDPDTAGKPLILSEWQGQGKTVGAWLGEFAKLTGYRWEVRSISGTWHFFFFNPVDAPTLAATAKNNIDYANESSSQWLILNEVKKRESRSNYANRVRYWGRYEPLTLPSGVSTWDEVLTESSAQWTAYTGCTVAEDAVNFCAGAKSIVFELTYNAADLVNRTMDFGYVLVPAQYRDFANNFVQNIRFNYRWVRGRNGDFDTDSTDWEDIPYHGTWGQSYLTCVLFSGDERGPYTRRPTNGFLCERSPSGTGPEDGTNGKWGGAAVGVHQVNTINVQDTDYFDANNVRAIGFRISHPSGVYPDWYVPAGETVSYRLYIDNFRLSTDKTPKVIDEGLFYVETAAVSAGTEVPIEAELSNRGLTMTEGEKLAKLWLDIKSANQIFINGGLTDKGTVDGVQFAGVRNIPVRSKITVATAKPTISATYSVTQVDYKPGEAGWMTEVQLGDMPDGLVQALESVKHGLANIVSDGQQT
jgi:hypothetical protein